MSSVAARQACSYFLARLQSEVSRLRGVAFPGHHVGPRKWLNCILGIIDTAREYLKRAADPNTAPVDQLALIRDAEELGNLAYQLLTHVAGADASEIPHQVVAPFQRWVEGLGINKTIFFRAEHLPNYELAQFDLSKLKGLNYPSQSLTNALAQISSPVLRVTVPSQAMGMLPHFAVVAHELGHAIQDEIKPDFSAHQQTIAASVTQIGARLNRQIGQEELVRTIDILTKWINELKADAVGHFVVGPAFFFALCGFLELSGPGYGVGPTHPPSDLRRKLLFDRLTTGTSSFSNVLTGGSGLALQEDTNSPNIVRCPAPDTLFNELTPKIGKLDAAICVELLPSITAMAPVIFDATHDYLHARDPALIYVSETLKADLDNHLDMLCNLVPPIEFLSEGNIKPCALASILNVGWVALLTQLDKLPKVEGFQSDPIAGKMEQLHDLLLKGVELSEAKQVWEEQT